MGSRRLGLARMEALLEAVDRELNLADSTLKNAALIGFTKGTATSNITAAMSGRTVIVGPLAAGLASSAVFSLPKASSGLWYRFLYVGGAADAENFTISTTSDTNFFIGGVIQHDIGGEDGTAYHPNNSSDSKITAVTPDSGTWIEVYCDGTNWFLAGWVSSTTGTGVTYAGQ